MSPNPPSSVSANLLKHNDNISNQFSMKTSQHATVGMMSNSSLSTLYSFRNNVDIYWTLRRHIVLDFTYESGPFDDRGDRPPARPPPPVYGHEDRSEQIFTYTGLLLSPTTLHRTKKLRLYIIPEVMTV